MTQKNQWISMTEAAKILHISVARCRTLLERELPTWAIETTLKGESPRHFRINRTRMDAWLNAEDLTAKSRKEEELC